MKVALLSVLLLVSLVPWFLLLLNAWVTTTLFSGLVDWLGG